MAFRSNGDTSYLSAANDFTRNIQVVREQNDDLRRVIRTIGTSHEDHSTAGIIQDICHTSSDYLKEANSLLSTMKSFDGLSARESHARQQEWQRHKKELEVVASEFKNLRDQAISKEKASLQRDRSASMAYNDSHDAPLLQQQQMSDAQDARMQAQYIQEREQAIEQLESDMTDLNEMFGDVAKMIQDQGQTLDNVAVAVSHGKESVSDGVVQLNQATKYQKSKRKKMMCVLVLFVIVAAVLAIILATTLS